MCLHDSNDALYLPRETENHLWDRILDGSWRWAKVCDQAYLCLGRRPLANDADLSV